MAMARASWADVAAVGLALQDLAPEGLVRGRLTIATPELLESLRRCLNVEDDSVSANLLDGVQEDGLQVGDTVHLQLFPKLGFGRLARDMDHLLKGAPSRIREPKNFALIADGYTTPEQVPDAHIVSRYRLVLRLIQSLKAAGASLDQDDETLVFFNDGRFDVPVLYTAVDLASLNVPATEALNSIIPQGLHEKQCRAILVEAVVGMCNAVPPPDRFRFLLANAGELVSRFEKGYGLFASGFSYEKVRDEIEAARVEYTGKLHKIVSDIQNQMLGIPVATIIVATQMKGHQAIDVAFWTSFAVLLGALVFAALTRMLLRNQRHTLEVIGAEISRQKGKLQKEHALIAANFTPVFEHLEERYRTQLRVLTWIGRIVLAGAFFSVWFFFSISEPAQRSAQFGWDWLRNLLS